MRFSRPALFCVLLLVAAAPALARPSRTIEILQPWARATPKGAPTGAVYLTIKNTGSANDRLLAAASPAAKLTQIHSMTMTGNIMRMREIVGGLRAPAGRTVALAPGGDHIMLIGLKKPLKVGGTVALTLTFKRAGVIRISAPIRPIGAMGPKAAKSSMSMGAMKAGAKQ